MPAVCAARFAGLAILFASGLAGQAPLRLATTSLPAGVVGTPYNFQLTATGGSGSYTWTWAGTPTLPPGLSLNNSSGFISGTPTVVGSYQVGITVTDTASHLSSGSFSLQVTSAGVTIATSLPAATVGQSYSQTLVTGGTPPYTLTITSGALPAGLSFNGTTGVLSGTPTASGSSTVVLQVTDSNKHSATATLTLTVSGAPLQITSPTGPLFNGTAGTPYTPTTFSAQGGTPPYTWSILSGSPDGLTMSAAGVLSGTPQTAGSFSFVVQVADSGGQTATETVSLTVNAPSLVITAASFPNGSVGVPYSQTTPAAVASGGTIPYTWSIVSGSVPGLTFVPSTVSLTGIPASSGTFSLTLQASDSSSPPLTGTKSFTVTITPAGLSITTARQLPNATLNVAYSQPLTATGGTPPYTWAANGLPKGLSINTSTGVISGVPTAAGTFPIIVITVFDNAQNHYQDNFSLTVGLPPVPTISVSGLPSTVNPASQFPLQVSLAAPYSNDITGHLIIGSQPNTGLVDSTIQFSTGGGTASFIIPTGQTSATFLDANGIPVSQLQIQTGTVAGSISVSLSNVNAAGVDITPVPAPTNTAQMAAQAPVISGVVVSSDGNGGCPKGQICLQVTGFSTTREVTQATYTFTAAAGQTLQSSASSVTVDVTQVFTSWFSSSTIGSQFILSQPFTVQSPASPASVIPASVTLLNRVGSTTFNIGQ